jgi:uncharacterized membrane protein
LEPISGLPFMKATYFLIRFLKIASLVAFIAMLFLAYFYLPNPVAIHFNDTGTADQYIDKPVLFYTCGIFIVLFNVILSIAARFVLSVPAQFFPMPNRGYWLADRESRYSFLAILRDWLNSFVFVGNMLVLACLFILMKLNRIEDVNPGNYSWILFAGLAALFIWLFFLPVRLLIKRMALLD